MYVESLFTLVEWTLLPTAGKATDPKRGVPFPESKRQGFAMKLTEEVAKIDTKLEGLMRELNKIKNQNRESEIREIRSHIKNLEKIRDDLLKPRNDIYKTHTIYDSK